MTLVEELRKRAEYARLEMLARPKDYVLGQTAYNARWKALLEAADLVEADPLRKAGSESLTLLKEAVRHVDGLTRSRSQPDPHIRERVGGALDFKRRAEAFLAALPKEPT